VTESSAANTQAARDEDRIRGALLGMVAADRTYWEPGPALSPLAATMLAVAEVFAADHEPHEGELARAIIDNALGDPRYDAELGPLFAHWESGIPLRIARLQVGPPGGLASDFPVAIMLGAGLRHGDAATAARGAREGARITHGDDGAVDAAGSVAAAVAALAHGSDPVAAAHAVTRSVELDVALGRLAELRCEAVPIEALCEHFGTQAHAVDTVAVALYCATQAESAEQALLDGFRAGRANAVAAITGALTGARFGASQLPPRLKSGLGQDTLDSLEELASRLAQPAP
jgi:ADP-ribosylglycohydrolase